MLHVAQITAFVPTFASADIQAVEVVQHGPQGPARLHVVHLLAQLDGGKRKKKPQRNEHQISSLSRADERNACVKPYPQHRALLEAKAILEQTSDVGHVHAQEGGAGRMRARLTAHCEREKEGVMRA